MSEPAAAEAPSVPAAPMPMLPAALRPLAWIEGALRWLLSHPLLTIQIVVFWLIAWGGLGADLGLDDIFWHDNVVPQFVVGLTVGLLFEQILFVRYLLDTRRGYGLFGLTFYPVKDPSIRGLGRFLVLFWPVTLAALVLPRLLSLKEGQAFEAHAPLLLGLGVAVTGSTLLVMLGEKLGLRERLQRSLMFRMTPGVAWGYLPKEDYPLHALALFVGLQFVAGVAVAATLHQFGHTLISPYVVLALMLAVINGVYGFLACQLRGLQHLAMLAIVLAGVVLNSNTFDPDHAYRMSFPHMEPYYAAVREAAHQKETPPPTDDFIRLDEESTGPTFRDKTEYYRQLIRSESHSVAAAGLIDSAEPLRAMHERWRAAGKPGKPRVVLICTSGGGIRAAVWTAVVLEGLEETVPGFRDHIRFVSGASGGMVGAGLYVADFENSPDIKADIDKRTGLSTYSSLLAKDSLSPAVQTMLLGDLPKLWVPRPNDADRGRALEEAWYRNTRRGERSPLEKSFKELRDLECQGKRPSLVYTPMLVEDARRLIISNLDLSRLTETHSQQLAGSNVTEAGEFEREGQKLRTQRALSAVEFFRLFPKAQDFRVSTAARMNASFPLVSPAVNLPTYPPRRVVDAGYYENYGPHIAALWLFANQQALRDHTSGVVMVEIRSSRFGYAKRHFQDKEKVTREARKKAEGSPGMPEIGPIRRDLVAQSLEGLSTPAEALITSQDRACWYRNDELIDLADRTFNTKDDPDFFTSVYFECKATAALSWTLNREDAWLIASTFWDDPEHKAINKDVARRLKELKDWFGSGGR